MYVARMPYSDLGAFSLKRLVTPPKWLRKIAGAVIRGSQVTVPTPTGPQVFDLASPDSLRALQELITGARIGLKPTPVPTPLEQIGGAVPGGWLTIGAGLALLMLVSGGLGRRSRRG